MKCLSAFVVTMMAAVLAQPTWADFDPSAATTLTMTTSDSNFRSSFTNAASWTAKSGVTRVAPQLMTQNTPPNPDAAGFDYYVPAGYTIRTLKAYAATVPSIQFGGRSLHIAGTFQAGNSYTGYPIGGIDLHYLEGSKVSLNALLGITNSQISVETTEAKPLWITQAQSTSTMTYANYDCSLAGASTAWIKVAGETATKGPVNWYYRGDGSDYLGTIELDASKGYDHAVFLQLGKNASLENATILLASKATLSVDNLADSVVKLGSVTLTSTGKITVPSSAKIQIGTLNMAYGTLDYTSANLEIGRCNFTGDFAGGTLTVPAKTTLSFANVSGTQQDPLVFAFAYDGTAHRLGQVAATGTFTGPVTLRLDSNFTADCCHVPAESILVSIAKSANPTKPEASAFVLERPNSPYGVLPTTSIRVDEGETTWNVVLVASPTVTLTRELGQTENWHTDAVAETAWSDGAAPSKDKDYLVAYQMYTCCNPSSSVCDFNMRSVTLAGGSFWINNTQCIWPELTQFAGGEITSSSNMDHVFTNGCFSVMKESDGTVLRPYGGYETATASTPGARFVFWAPFVGSGTVKIVNRGAADPWKTGKVNFGGSAVKLMVESPDFTGRWNVTQYEVGVRYPYTYLESTRLCINENLAMGGSPASFVYNALTLSSYACLEPLKTMTLDVENRGIFIHWAARVNVVEGFEFVVKEPLTFAGTWEKIGTGTLWLGASEAPRFLSKRQELPPSAAGLDGTNVLAVTAGALGVTSHAAVNGLSVQFGENGRLAVDSNVAEGDMKTQGLYNANGSVTKAGTGDLVVSFTTPSALEVRTLGVMTIPTSQAEAFIDAGRPKLTGAPHGFSAVYSAETSGDLTTFKVTLTPLLGIQIFFR